MIDLRDPTILGLFDLGGSLTGLTTRETLEKFKEPLINLIKVVDEVLKKFSV